MKLKVSLFQQQYPGAPLTDIDAPVFVNWEDQNVSPFPSITKAVVALLRENISHLPAPEVIDMIERTGIDNMIQLNEVNAYLNNYASLTVIVAATGSDIIPELAETDFTIMVLTPINSMFKMRTDYISNDQDFSIREIVADIVSKFNIGSGLVPTNDLVNLVRSMEDMALKGLPMTEVFQNSLVSQLANYGCEIYFIYQ